MKVFLAKVSVLAGSLMIAFIFIGWAKAPQKIADIGLCPIKESAAYAQFLSRPVNEYSKTLYLIERFKVLPFEIVYDGRSYKMKPAAGIAIAFLKFNYKKNQQAKHWVLQYANRSLVQNELIMVRLPDGRLFRAGDLLIQELENLEKALSEKPESSPAQMDLPNQFNARIEGAAAITPEAIALPAATK